MLWITEPGPTTRVDASTGYGIPLPRVPFPQYLPGFHSRRLALGVALTLALILGHCPGADAAGKVTIEASATQAVTVSGRSDSLRTVLEDVCFRTGVELVFYDANDRSFGGSYRDLPVKLLFARLLRDESYMVETTGDARSGTERVTTLRVLGDPAVASARRARGGSGSARRHWQVPPVLLQTAFGDKAADSTERDAALATLASRISNDPTQLKGFLSTDSHQIALALRRFQGVDGPLRELKQRYPDPRIAQKIDEVLAALASLNGTQPE